MYDLRLELTAIPQSTPPGRAIAELRWQSATTPHAIIPSDNLYPEASLDTFVAAFTLLHKTSLLVHGFRLSATELAYLADQKLAFDNFALNSLPLDRSDPVQTDQKAVGLFRQWRRLNDVAVLRDSLPQSEVTLIDVFRAESLAEAIRTLKQASGWDSATLEALVGPKGFNLAAKDFNNEIWPTRLQSCVRLIRRLGVSATEVFEWATEPTDAAQAQAIKNTVKAKYDDEAWMDVARPLTDKLRESQKAALVAYLLPILRLEHSNQLFEYFLIDVDMSACMATSRIKQAISSVQLFVQRCLMNLEERDDRPELSISPSAIDAQQWQWMKHYRVWEANRKVFLYPENWIVPELRDDKSPFFKDLESELLQNDPTNDTAETALVGYLDKLERIARLEICAMCRQDNTEGDEGDVLHVFARTINIPHVYYYRRWENSACWTPWEHIQLDIEGTEIESTYDYGKHHGVHLIPAIWNRRLHLFWPIFAKDPSSNGVLEIKLAWSRYHDDKWSAKEVLAGSLHVALAPDAPGAFDERYNHLFRTFLIGDDLVIQHLYTHPNSDDLIMASYGVWLSADYKATFSLGDTLDVEATKYSEWREVVTPNSASARFMRIDGITNETFGLSYGYPYAVPSDKFDQTFVAGDERSYAKYAHVSSSVRRELTLLRQYVSDWSIVYPHQKRHFVPPMPFFFQDRRRSYFINSDTAAGKEFFGESEPYRFSFSTFSHPHVTTFAKALNRGGVSDLLTVANQQLGNPYLHSPWKLSRWGAVQTISAKATGPGSFIQSDYRSAEGIGNFEAVVMEGTQLVHYFHNASTDLAWQPIAVITSAVTGPGCLIQGDAGLGKHGNFDVVVTEGNSLVHWWRDNADPSSPWRRGRYITLTGPSAKIHSTACSIVRRLSGGQWRLIVLTIEDGEIAAYIQETGPQSDSSTVGKPWQRQQLIRIMTVGDTFGFVTVTSPVTGAVGVNPHPSTNSLHDLELAVLEGSDLVHYIGNSSLGSLSYLTRKRVITAGQRKRLSGTE